MYLQIFLYMKMPSAIISTPRIQVSAILCLYMLLQPSGRGEKLRQKEHKFKLILVKLIFL